MEDNLTSADSLSYTTNGFGVDLGSLVSASLALFCEAPDQKHWQTDRWAVHPQIILQKTIEVGVWPLPSYTAALNEAEGRKRSGYVWGRQQGLVTKRPCIFWVTDINPYQETLKVASIHTLYKKKENCTFRIYSGIGEDSPSKHEEHEESKNAVKNCNNKVVTFHKVRTSAK